jgi:hypothetical protein
MEKTIDPQTQEEFIKQRNNQKFASSKNRIQFNNYKARQKRLIKASVDKILDKNRTILNRILGDKAEAIVSKEYLMGAEFSFNYYSFLRKVDEVTYFGIYEFGITNMSGDYYKIINLNHESTS